MIISIFLFFYPINSIELWGIYNNAYICNIMHLTMYNMSKP